MAALCFAIVEGTEKADIDKALTAELVGDYLLTDYDFIKQISVENRNVFQRLWDEVKYLCKVASAGSKEARQFERVKRNFEKAYKEAATEKSTADEGGVRYSFADKPKGNGKIIVESIKQNINKISEESKFNVESEVLPEGIRKSDYVFKIFEEQGKIAKNNKLGPVELTRAGATSTVFHGFGNEKLAAVRAIKSVIENGDIIEENLNYENNGVDRIIIAAKGTINNSPSYVGVIIRRFYNKKMARNCFYLHEALVEKTDSPIMTGPQLSGDTVSESVSNNSISNLSENVNTSDSFSLSAKSKNTGNIVAPMRHEITGKDFRVKGADGATQNSPTGAQQELAPVGRVPIETKKQKLAVKAEAYQTEVDKNIQLRNETAAYYDEKISAAEEAYNALKNKHSKKADRLQRSIERSKRLKAKTKRASSIFYLVTLNFSSFSLAHLLLLCYNYLIINVR